MRIGALLPTIAKETPRASRPAAMWAAAALTSVVAVAMVARWIQTPPYDDAYITFRYAANLRDGFGLVFNPGEQLFAVTTPLFALLLGALASALAGADVAALGYWLSLAALGIAGALASAILWHEDERAAALLAPFAVILAPTVVYSVGQEIGLLLALGFAGFYLWRRRQLEMAAVALGLLALTRPDGLILGGVILLAEVYRTRRLPIRPALLFALVAGSWYLYAWSAYGSPFPFSLAAKTAQAQTGWWPTTGPATWSWLQGLVRDAPLTLGLAGLGLAYAAARARWALLILSWPLLQLAGYVLLGVAFYTWYVAPLHGILGLFVALGAGLLARLVKRLGPRWVPVATAVFVAACLAVIVPSVQYVRTAGQDIPNAPMRQYEEIGLWLREHTLPLSSVAALEMGRLGYFSQRPMFDFVGLVKPPVVDHLRQKDLIWSVKNYLPEYVVAIPPDRWLLDDAWFQATYLPLRHFTDPGSYDGQPTTVFVRAVGEPAAKAPDTTLGHRFGDQIELAGYSWADPAASADGSAAIVLHWRALKPTDEDYVVYVHALDEADRLVGQADGPSLGGNHPTSRWRPGETVLDLREIAVATRDTAVRLHVGWYLLETMQRLPGVDATGQPAESAVIDLGAYR